MRQFILFVVAFLLPFSIAHRSFGWSECGHHIIATLAYDMLDNAEQTELRTILAKHPRFEEDFTAPKKIQDVIRWQIGRAGYWPDVARSQPKYNRPTWHYQLGATIDIGNEKNIHVPEEPGPLPNSATLETQELYIVQAIQLCRKVLGDREQSPEDRAIALCWIAHLVGDAHQPCHAGSIYIVDVFPDGDRGANLIKTQAGNLHSLWDGLLGRRFNEGDVRRRQLEIVNNKKLMLNSKTMTNGKILKSPVWIAESRGWAKRYVYTTEVMGPIRAVSNGLAQSLPKLSLSEDYLQQAGETAQIRAAMAGIRLAAVWREAIAGK